MRRVFCLGILCSKLSDLMHQDYIGQAAYMAKVQADWIPVPWYLWLIPLFGVAEYTRSLINRETK